MRMKNPPHPGRIVRQECIEPLGLTVTETAKRLGVTRQALHNLVNGKGGISAEMAVRLSKAFGSSPEVWLGMQMEYDLAQVEKGGPQHQGETGCVRLLIHGDEPARSAAHGGAPHDATRLPRPSFHLPGDVPPKLSSSRFDSSNYSPCTEIE